MKKTPMLPDEAPTTYEELVALYPPRKIRSESDHEIAAMVADWISFRARDSDAQLDYLETLGDLLDVYETRSELVPQRPPAKSIPLGGVLELLMEEHELSTEQLANILGIERTHAWRILRGERGITNAHAIKLGEHFHVSPTLFLAPELTMRS